MNIIKYRCLLDILLVIYRKSLTTKSISTPTYTCTHTYTHYVSLSSNAFLPCCLILLRMAISATKSSNSLHDDSVKERLISDYL